jgi:hypothetical protein
MSLCISRIHKQYVMQQKNLIIISIRDISKTNMTSVIGYINNTMIKLTIYINSIDWLIDLCLTSSEQFFSYIQDENI